MTYSVGTAVRINTEVRDLAGVLTNATVSVVVTKPDGTTSSPTVNTTGTGLYNAVVTADQAGLWTYVWTASGAVVAVEDGQFDVKAVPRALVVSLEKFKSHLRITATTDDTEIREVLEAVTDAVEPVVGPVAPRTFTEFVDVNGRLVAPMRGPIVSVTSLTPDLGSAVDSSRYTVDTDLGVIRLRFWTRGQYTLVYRAGHNPWPAALRNAGKIICQHEWRVRNANGGRPAPDEDAMMLLPGSGFLVPHRAYELMKPYILPGLA